MAAYETVIEKTIVNMAEMQGYFVRKVEWPGRRGAPDRVFIKGGRVIWIEFKDEGKEPEPHQAKEHRRMRDHGAVVHVCDNIPLGKRILGLR